MRIIDLPKATRESDFSPTMNFDGTNAIISYGDEATTITLNFSVLYGFQYVDFEYINTLDYTFGLVEIENSQWTSEFIEAWAQRDRNKEDAFGKEASQILHYRLCFDEYGMYDILCKELRVEKFSTVSIYDNFQGNTVSTDVTSESI